VTWTRHPGTGAYDANPSRRRGAVSRPMTRAMPDPRGCRSDCRPLALSLLVVAPLLAGTMATGARAESLPLWGYGVKGCDEFLAAAAAAEGSEAMAGEYRRYEDWLTGFVSGLGLATGTDVLRGADIDAALRRIRAHCDGHRRDDFFTATMDLVRMLGRLR